MRQMVTGYFEEHNVPAGAVSSRSELSRHFAAANPSLIILDLRLGQDDGLDLLREIAPIPMSRLSSPQGIAVMKSTVSSASSSVPTITLPSRSVSGSCLPASARFCGDTRWDGRARP